MKKVRRKLNRIGALALAVVLMGTSIDFPVIAAGNCEHHTEHTEECGYKAAVEGSECTHEHGDECYSEAEKCVHNHDGECGYVEAVEGSDCNHSHDESCGENGADCNHEHDDSCGYKEAQEGSECNHECSEESGCITLEENCNHSHDESCGYKEAVEGAPCIFACDDCASEESGQENEEENDTCICEDKCTADAVNEECPVCSLEEADLTLCVGEETIICTCGTDDPAFHATNCPAYIAPENPQCFCAEKCTDDTLNIWCDVCGVQGVNACQGEDTATTYAETPDFSAAKVLTAVDGALYIDGVALTINTNQFGNTSVIIPEGNYKLTGDIATDIFVYTEGSINLDLNGYAWDMSGKYLLLKENATLSLYDTSVNKTGKITSSFVQTIYLNGSGSTFNLYSGTVENTSDDVNAQGVSSNNGSSNLYGGTIKSNAYAVFYDLGDDITINIDNTSFDCGDGYAQIYTSLSSYYEPCAVIDVSDYEGGTLTVDAKINKAGKIKIFTGIQSTQDPENYKVNVRFDADKDFFEEKQEYEEDGGNKYVYVSVPSFTTQPTEENGYTVAFNHPDATLQWFEKTVFNSATYTEDERVIYEVNAGDALVVSLSECSDDFHVDFDCTCNDEEISYMFLDSSRKTASVTFDFEGTVDVHCMTSPFGTGVYKIEHVRYTELEGENGVQLSKTECETTYVCKATLGEREYYSDEVTIEQEHSYTCTATSDNVITKECDTCGKSGTLTITAEGGVYDGTTAYGATVIKTGILENEEVTVSYYQGDTLIGTDAPVDAGTYTAKITYEGVTASVTFMISTTPTAEMFTYTSSAVYDGTEKSANVVVKDDITGIGEITNIKYYQNDIEVTPVNAGTYTVKIDVAEGDDYAAATDIEVGTFEITKANPRAEMFTYTAPTNLDYDGQIKKATVTTDKVGMGEITVKYSGNPVTAGTYTVSIDVEASTNYNAVSNLPVGEFTINKVDSVITAAPTPIADLVYDGTAQNLINAGTATGGEMQYSLDGTNYSPTIPTGTDAKTYTVWYKVVGDANHNDTEAASIEVTIAPKSVTVTADNKSKTYGEADPEFTYTVTGLVGNNDTLTGTLSREPGENAGTYVITQGTLNNPNYDITIVGGVFTINKATPAPLTTPTAENAITYGEKLSAVTLNDSSWAWLDGTIVPDASTDCIAYIEVDDSNYDYTDVNGYDSANHRVVRGVDVIISRATLTITANSYTIKVGEALPTYEYTVTGLVGDDTLPVDVTISCSATDSNAEGTYPITISGVASDALASLYAPIYVNGELTITEKDIQKITADDITLTYGETGKKIAATTSGDGAISYSTTSDVISVAADGTITALKAGTATVTIRAAETADYAEAIKTISVTVNKAENAPNMPGTTMSVPYSNKTVSAVTLPTGWEWQDADKNTSLEVGVVTNATAIYTGSDKGNYENESVTVAITRSNCEHANTEVRGAKTATCKETGYTGDTYCKDCEECIVTGTVIPLADHTDGNSDDRCDNCGTELDTASDIGTFSGWSVSLDEKIGVNFYMILTDAVKQDAGAYVLFTWGDNESSQVYVSEAGYIEKNNEIWHKFSCDVVAAQMTDEITAKLVTSDMGESSEYTYSVSEYIESKHSDAESSGSDTLVELLEAMANYGAYAQLYFNYNPSDLANDGMGSELGDVTLSGYDKVINGTLQNGVSYLGSSLLLESEVVIRHYFSITDGAIVAELNHRLGNSNWSELTSVGNGRYYTEQIVVAVELNDAKTLELDGWSIQYSAMSYAQSMLNGGTTNEKLKNLLKALYYYSEAADAYFGQ